MATRINYKLFQNCTAVPTAVTDAVKLASGDAVRCILYILSHQDEEISGQHLADQLHISLDDAEEAILFWASLSVLETDDQKAEEAQTDTATVVSHKAKALFSQSVQKPSRAEISRRSSEDEDIRFLLQQAELYLSRSLTVADAGTLIAIHDFVGMESSVLLTLIAYCCSKKETGMRYIQKEAIAWADAGINTCDKAEEHIRILENRERAAANIRKILHLPEDRVLKPSEKEMAADWLCSMDIPLELLEAAAERCVKAYGTVNFAKVGKTAANWLSKGLRTLQDIEAYELTTITSKKSKKEKSQGFVSSVPSFTAKQVEVHTTSIPKFKLRGENDD